MCIRDSIDSAVTGRSHGHPVRCLRNQMTRQYVKLEEEGKSFEELEYLTLGGLRKAVMDGDVTDGVVMAGQIAGMVKKEQTLSLIHILFEMVMALEDEYSVEIPAEDLQNLLTVGDVMKYLKDKGVE